MEQQEIVIVGQFKMPKSELEELYSDLTIEQINKWLKHYLSKQNYEVCAIIRDALNSKSQPHETH